MTFRSTLRAHGHGGPEGGYGEPAGQPGHGSGAASAPKIQLENVSLAYGTSLILDDITLAVEPGKVASVIGASGCGKTTLLHIVAGLVAYDTGRVTVDGIRVERPGPDRAVVFQEDAVFPWMNVRKNVEYGLRAKGVARAERNRIADEVLEIVGLQGRESYLPKELSGGMRKRVDLARALAVKPEVLLMDEPYAALDAMTREKLQIDFLAIAERLRTTALFVTHDLEEALFVGDDVVIMGTNPGRIESIVKVSFGHPRERALKQDSDFQRVRSELAREIAAITTGGIPAGADGSGDETRTKP